MNRFLILTAGFGEGHNAAARGLHAALKHLGPDVRAEVHDVFAETFGSLYHATCRSYLTVINRAPQLWSRVYSSIDQRQEFRRAFRLLAPVRNRLAELVTRTQPEAIVSVYPAYAHFLDFILGPANGSIPRRFVCVTDSVTINAIWFRCSADAFFLANEESALRLQAAGIPDGRVCVFGFPVHPGFAGVPRRPQLEPPWRVLYMVNPRSTSAPAAVSKLAALPNIQLTVTTGRDDKLRAAIKSVRARSSAQFKILGWTAELPRLLASHHMLVSKAGGATVQEAIAARCPMIITQIVPGQEEGNAEAILAGGCGCLALSPEQVGRAVLAATQHEGEQLRKWSANIARISRPAAALEMARFLLEL